jgi:uncharacterized membrane protein HdeD (DUF308 family)
MASDSHIAVSHWRRLRGLLVVIMGLVCVVAPFFIGKAALSVIGLFLVVSGVLELIETFSVSDEAGQRSTYLSGFLSIGAGVLLENDPQIVLRGVVIVVGVTFVLDGASHIIAGLMARWRKQTAANRLVRGLVYLALGVVLLGPWQYSRLVAIGAVMGLRMVMSGWSMLTSREPPTAVEQLAAGAYPDPHLGLPPHPRFAELDSACAAEYSTSSRYDVRWYWILLATFFAIHFGRMATTWNLVGTISPLVASVGDVVLALGLAFGILLPLRMLWRRLTRPIERSGWRGQLARLDNEEKVRLRDRVWRRWLAGRLRFSWRVSKMRRSLGAALRWGLHVGLPVAALLIALNPIWGFSWHFNTENWATEIWSRWAEARTDTWREAMIQAVRAHYPSDQVADGTLFRVEPGGVNGTGDFSFIVIGDTGEGDASQFCLKDRYVDLGKREDMKFLVVSSDVIYPSGAMEDYEPKFYLPFKGFTKPIYAIPGNHDWYDALEGFAANFLEADAARASMKARVEIDKRVTTTTDRHIDNLIAEAARLRREYGEQAGFQRGTFFEIQTDRFALLAVDTGVARDLDPLQLRWLRAALDRAKGKCIFAILGHPLYAGGRYQGLDDEPFAAIHQLLREHKVAIVMAGDTHYFEHYRDTYPTPDGTHTALHFVNGGGGAYMSIGTPLDWPDAPSVPDATYFPSKKTVYAKLDRELPRWKWPLWYWTKRFRAWPFNAELMSGAFDYNHAPYLQSFVEVKVERSANRVRLILHSAAGPVRWHEMDTFGTVRPSGAGDGDVVEFIVPLPR